MKKLILLIIILSSLFTIGCGKESGYSYQTSYQIKDGTTITHTKTFKFELDSTELACYKVQEIAFVYECFNIEPINLKVEQVEVFGHPTIQKFECP